MAIIAGQAVRGKDYWDRPFILEDIIEVIERGEHILLVAPRRVGKTSLMYRIMDTVGDEYVVIYVNTQAAHSESQFWEKLFDALMDEDFIATLQQRARNFWNTLSSLRLSEVGSDGIKFGDSEAIDYEKAFEMLLKSYDGDKKLVIMMDEFSQTIENIIQYENVEKAEKLLEVHRELRQNHKLSQKSAFVYAGSIGLESVVANMKSSKDINDLVNIDVPPLEKGDAEKFILHLCLSNGMKIEESDIKYILEKIEWLIPFYIQLIIQELKRFDRRGVSISNQTIDDAIEKVLSYKKVFVHWLERLEIFKKEEKNFAKDVLNTISKEKSIVSTDLYNMANKYKLSDYDAQQIVHALKYDGYINNSDNEHIYRFNSPILRIWWYKNVAN
ncbi:MAG: Unknown protein [uncultured Sulfurovum sp.]|uniref:ATPase domain-containing protein n=1 Tax=uncultured Sulfurovum sp. TaxID=269237 RepID=A0A6S6TPU1_9BACT|nr:MAG: Unknown protein [uncultured Sulfurovum sp.]